MAYRFSWDAFNDETVEALVDRLDWRGTAEDARGWLARHARRPDRGFVKRTKDVLENTWLRDYLGVGKVVDSLRQAGIGPHRRSSPDTHAGYIDYIRECRNSATIQNLLLQALLDYGDVDRQGDGEASFDALLPRSIAVLEPGQQAVDQREPHPYQRDAWAALSGLSTGSTQRVRGLLVMPTGSGKTFTTARWLMHHVVNRGGQVLWLAHRHELLNQAAREFHRLVAYAPDRDRVRVRIVSGAHRPTSTMGPDDDVIVASVWSLARRHDILDDLLRARDVFLVVDEAHRAPAKSYRDIIRRVAEKERSSILGLTATPTRTVEDERPELSRLFEDRIVHQVEVRPLIEQGYLARPLPVRVPTEARVELGVTASDRKHLAQFGELSEEWLDRIAHLPKRNKVIVGEYLEDLYGPTRKPGSAGARRYGKTIIYAINVLHAALLKQAFTEADIESEYVTYYRPDGSGCDYGDVLSRFADPESGLDILINVEMFTEGFDVPAVKTVFLTRPTGSEILLRQMIGRALRGRHVGGTDEAYIVSFEDHWERFRDWESPFELVVERYLTPQGPDPAPDEALVEPPPAVVAAPWDLIATVARAIQAAAIEHKADLFEAIPCGWYVLEREVEGDGVRQVIHVYEHQIEGWRRTLEYLAVLGERADERTTVAVLLRDYFGAPSIDWTDPDYAKHRPGPTLMPSDLLLEQAIEHFAAGGEMPGFHSFEQRACCDPYAIARQIREGDLRQSEIELLVASRYETELARAVYRSMREFRAAIDDALFELAHPGASTRRVAVPVFDESWPTRKLAPANFYDLPPLFEEMFAIGRSLLPQSTITPQVELEWTTVVFRGFFARAFPTDVPGKGLIQVNRLLCSPDVSRETMRFLLWHEYLHLHLLAGHTEPFRALERAWPGAVAADRELDTLVERFDLRESWHADGAVLDGYAVD